MNQVPFPFTHDWVLIFNNPHLVEEDNSVFTEIAESRMEIFQALSYRKEMVVGYRALTLNLLNPYQQNMVLFENEFPIRVITVGLDDVVNNIYDVKEKSQRGYFIKSFSGLKRVILTPTDDDFDLRLEKTVKLTTSRRFKLTT